MPTGQLKRLLQSDAATIRGLYKEHFPTVKRYVLQNSGTRDDAQDIFQEALTVLWLKLKEVPEWTPGADVGGFLFRVAKNKWLDMLRSAEHRKGRQAMDASELEIGQENSDHVEERLQRLRTIYAALDERCRAVLDRFYYERQDLSAIAASLGVEEESIRTIKYRCMMKLRAFRNTIAGEDKVRMS